MSPTPDSKGPELPRAIELAAASYEEGRLAEAAEACAAYLESHPGHFDALHLAGAIKIAQRDAAAAVALLTAAVKLRPRSPEAALNLSVALQDTGDAAGALAQADRALALRPAFTEAHNIRGNALRTLGRPEEALACYECALALRFDYPDVLNNRAAALIDLGRDEEALESCTQALTWKPDFAEAHFNRGNAFKALGRYARALGSYDEALRIRPAYGAALTNKIAILMQLNRNEDAMAAASAVAAGDPEQVGALINYGVAAHKLGRIAEAVAAYDAALEGAPDNVLALNNRGAALRDLGRQGEALASFERALAAQPGNGIALDGACFAALNLCDWDKAERFGAEIVDGVEAGNAASPFVMLNLTGEPRLHGIAATNLVCHEVPAVAPPTLAPARRSGKIRLAYVSADFNDHAIAHLIVELIERHDRAAFEVVGVSFGRDDGSPVRARLLKAFDRFQEIAPVSDQAAAKLMRDRETDIAIDLTGYTRNCRLGIFAARAAPVQVNYLGYPGTMGASFMDYLIADPVVLPLDEQQYVTEKIVHLPDCYQPNDTRRAIAEPPSREAAGLPAGGFVFCCFNNSFKIRRSMFETWMRLLTRVDGSVLWLLRMNDAARDRLRSEATARGIDPGRLVFAEWAPPAQHLARHRLADIFLDTLPYNAHTTASDALWAGLPVVTCKGVAFPGRVAASLLTAIGLADLIAPDLAAYEALALRLATEPEFLADCGRRLGENRTTAPLFDIDHFRRHLEEAYAKMHELRRAGAAPQSFAVAPT
jgi:predicted O-linked N-acetylglucosamine transferase (SPINDLY family)